MATFDITPEARASYGQFFKRQFFVKPPVAKRSEVDLTGKTVIVTGSNTGLGFECNKQLLDLGLSRLIIAVRSETKGETAKKELLLNRSASNPTIEVWKLDLSSYDSVIAFVERTKSLERLDIVINNAGVSRAKFELNTATGHEEDVQTNYLSLALFTILILPVLQSKNSPQQPGRLSLVSSETASWAKFKERDSVPILAAFDKPESFDFNDRYPTSKLLGQLFITELVKRVPPSVAVINAPNPGMCKSGLIRDLDSGIVGFIMGIVTAIVARPTAIGARAITDAAIKHGSESHGQYVEDGKIQPMAPLVYKPEGAKIAKVLWEETMNELAFAGAADIVKSLSDGSHA
ncbi:hypothetical protein G7046_g140 [Stylonectria norvegica]|nr:hypothetical protein G7046_g140 [Stylonectria norvegica]